MLTNEMAIRIQTLERDTRKALGRYLEDFLTRQAG
ncbi:MAG: hypothetical protein ACI8TF_000228 [Paracoccaceae bacterium]|jgi:hypothetical protein